MLKIERSGEHHITVADDNGSHYEIHKHFLDLLHVAMYMGHTITAIKAIRAIYPMDLGDANGLTVWVDICNKRSNLFSSTTDADEIWTTNT